MTGRWPASLERECRDERWMYLISFSFGLERRVVAVRDGRHGVLFGWTAGLCSKWSPARQAKIIGWPKVSWLMRTR